MRGSLLRAAWPALLLAAGVVEERRAAAAGFGNLATVADAGADFPRVFFMTAWPGTPLFERLAQDYALTLRVQHGDDLGERMYHALDDALAEAAQLSGDVRTSVVAVIGLGLVLTHRSSGVVNLAHAAMGMYVAYAYFEFRETGDWVLPILGLPDRVHLIPRPTLATALTFGLAFGLQEIFANFVAGLILLFERPIKVGDVIQLGLRAHLDFGGFHSIGWDIAICDDGPVLIEFVVVGEENVYPMVPAGALFRTLRIAQKEVGVWRPSVTFLPFKS